MSHPSPARRLAALAVAVAVVLPAPSYAGRPARAATKPVVGECRSLTLDQASAASDPSAPVDCASPHDDRVIAVPNLPKAVTYADLDTPAKLDKVATKRCYPAFRAALGQTDLVRDRSAYAFLYFVPTAGQRAAGARWLRCDLTLRHGARLADLPTDREPALAGPHVPAAVARCLTGPHHLATTCTARHSYRATGSFTVDLTRYPGRARMLQIGRNRCPSLVSTDHAFRFTWGRAAVYDGAHDRTVVCYSHVST